MNKEKIRAYLWQAIIRLGFSPVSTKDQRQWLVLYGQSIKQFWEIPSYPEKPRMENGRIKGSIDCTNLLHLYFEYDLETTDKFNFHYLYSHPRDHRELVMWVHDVDEGGGKHFCFPKQLFLNRSTERLALRSFANDDIEAVTDGLLFHPKAHQHLESPINEHEIRIGGGIDNPFLYLFHLRYQFCPIPHKRAAEKNRLIALFTDALRNNRSITAHDLMAQPATETGRSLIVE